jgi:hypothetical protein
MSDTTIVIEPMALCVTAQRSRGRSAQRARWPSSGWRACGKSTMAIKCLARERRLLMAIVS